MKELEKLADEFARSEDAPGCCDCLEDAKDSYMAGFRKAREMAAEMADESSPNTGDPVTSDQIRQLGEKEI